ncbi:hypothetical protein [Chryseobacterium sp.]|uniref:tetratricopeptide repeat protein n=1 Tax=Chryseobacterium sp. TaxID=1871047 RepID=UPI00289A89CE|nr:hypothetical protein [Chryseobacterium sp.]
MMVNFLKISCLILLFLSICISAQKQIKTDAVVQSSNGLFTITSNKIMAPLKINFEDLPMENLKDRMGETFNGKDIYFLNGDIVALGSCCAFKAKEFLYYKYLPVYKNWVLYKSYYEDIEIVDGITDIKVTYYPYSLGINSKEYTPNKKLYLQDSVKNKITSETIFNSEYEKMRTMKNLKSYSFNYSYENLSLLIKEKPITNNTLDKYNNLAFYIAQTKEGSFKAIYLYNEILDKFPTRVVTYLNLGDCYWNIGIEDLAKENYKKYIALMKSQNKDLKKIPKQVWERVN